MRPWQTVDSELHLCHLSARGSPWWMTRDGETATHVFFTGLYTVPATSPQTSRIHPLPTSLGDRFIQTCNHGNGPAHATVSLTLPDGKGIAFSIICLLETQEPKRSAVVGGHREIKNILWGRRMPPGASTDRQGRNGLLLPVRTVVGSAHRWFWLALKERNSFREETLNILSAFEVTHNDILWFLAQGRGLGFKAPFTYQELNSFTTAQGQRANFLKQKMLGWRGSGKHPFCGVPHEAKKFKSHRANFLRLISFMSSLLYYSDQFCGTRGKAIEAERGSDASRTFLKPSPGATCPNDTCLTDITVSVQTIAAPPKQGTPSSLQCHPSSGSPMCDIIFHRGVRGTHVSAAACSQFSRAPRLVSIPHGGSRPSGRPLHPYILRAQC